MKHTKALKCALFLLLALSIFSCRPKKEVIYLQGADSYSGGAKAENYETRIQPDDVLQIIITSQNSEASDPFNQKFDSNTTNNNIARGYLVDKDGNIEFPVLGKIKVAGYTRTEFVEMMKQKLVPYLSDAQINLRVSNFKVSVFGEVGNPGIISVTGDRITILEAITQAGDLTIQGIRTNILIVRDNQGEKSFARVDLTDAKIVDSPYYYLKQNDVVYVEPRRAKYDATALGPYLTATASILSLLVTVTLLIIRF